MKCFLLDSRVPEFPRWSCRGSGRPATEVSAGRIISTTSTVGAGSLALSARAPGLTARAPWRCPPYRRVDHRAAICRWSTLRRRSTGSDRTRLPTPPGARPGRSHFASRLPRLDHLCTTPPISRQRASVAERDKWGGGGAMANGMWPRLRGCLALSAAAIVLLSGCTGSATTLPSSAPLTPGGSFVGTVTSEGDGSATGSPASSPTPSTASSAPVGPSSLSSPLGLGTPPRTSPTSSPPNSTTPSPSASGSIPPKTPTSPVRPPTSKSPGGSTPTHMPTSAPQVTVVTDGLSDQEVADRAAIEQAWFHYWEIYLKFYDATPAQRVQMLQGVTIEPQTSKLIQSGILADKEKARARGQVKHRFYWGPPVDGESQAVVGDCMDTSKYGSYYSRLANSAPSEFPARISESSCEGLAVKPGLSNASKFMSNHAEEGFRRRFSFPCNHFSLYQHCLCRRPESSDNSTDLNGGQCYS